MRIDIVITLLKTVMKEIHRDTLKRNAPFQIGFAEINYCSGIMEE